MSQAAGFCEFAICMGIVLIPVIGIIQWQNVQQLHIISTNLQIIYMSHYVSGVVLKCDNIEILICDVLYHRDMGIYTSWCFDVIFVLYFFTLIFILKYYYR